ncbi:MAG: hypothetical protein ABIL01_30905 [Pseudomonadota bacterium]
MTSRDEFSQATKKTLAIRAAHFCSNPDCIKLTAGPHSDESKSLSTGHAAHIHAAAPNGPRYNQAQSPAERRAIANGLWLCRVCGDLVDKDAAPYSAELLRHWKRNHEAMIAEVGTKGYSQSLTLIQTRRAAPALAKQIIAMLEDRRVFWASFDAEFPDRVRHSLDSVRSQLVAWRSGLPDGSGLDQILLSLTKTIHVFFDEVEQSDLSTLRCNGNDPEWRQFRDALSALRKSVGFQIGNLATAYDIKLSADLKRIAPMPTA